MLVTFSCPAYADITMFGDVALHLLKLMGHSGTVPSALLAEDVEAALQCLQTGLAAEQQPAKREEVPSDDEDEPVVPLARRALPLIELMKAATAAQCNVMWDSNA